MEAMGVIKILMIAVLVVLGVIHIFWLIMWVQERKILKIKNQDLSQKNDQLKKTVNILIELNRDNLGRFDVYSLKELHPDHVAQVSKKIADIFWRKFYQNEGKLDMSKLGNFIFFTQGFTAESKNPALMKILKNIVLEIPSFELAFQVTKAVKEEATGEIKLILINDDNCECSNLNHGEIIIAKDYILKSLRGKGETTELFLQELNEATNLVLETEGAGKGTDTFKKEIEKICDGLK